jgi:hypothetical protein
MGDDDRAAGLLRAPMNDAACATGAPPIGGAPVEELGGRRVLELE